MGGSSKGYGGDAVATSDGNAIFMAGYEQDGPVVLYKMDGNLNKKWEVKYDHKCEDDPAELWRVNGGPTIAEQNFPRKAHLSLSDDDKTGK